VTATATATPVLSLRAISKSFGAVQALTDAEIDVMPGEVVALVGDNGAGKSTLVKVISGVGPADTGTIEWEGQHVAINGPKDAQKLGIATVYQDLALADNLDVVGNLFLGQEVRHGGVLDDIDMEQKARELLQTLSVKIPSVRTQVASLSGGQRQSVSIARSLLGDPKVVMLDEPTAALGVAQTAEVLALIKRLKERGYGLVLISHNLADIFEVADRIIVLRLGRNAGVFNAHSDSSEDVVAAITGATDSAALQRERARIGRSGGSEQTRTGGEEVSS
jgi:D-xylose transport system ATP-binding protein